MLNKININTILLCALALYCISTIVSCQFSVLQSEPYIDKESPGLEGKVFSHNFISKDSISEFGSVFNKKGNEFFFAIDSAGKAKILFTKLLKDTWIEPRVLIENQKYSYNDPFLSPDESKLYYISNQPTNPNDTIDDYDIWYSERKDNGWSEPINAGSVINSDANEYYISFTENGSMYYASNKGQSEKRQHDFDIYKSELINNIFQEPERISDSINTKRYEADVFISPDESYIIFCSFRREGFGKGDLYISFQDEKSGWSQAKNMGPKINSKHHELCPFVSRDGKYLFYTSNQDIYWISAEVIDSLR